MPSWNDNTIPASNLPDSDAAIRAELTASSGGGTLASVLSNGNNANDNVITGLAPPQVSTDAVHKQYVDARGLSQVLTAGNSAAGANITNLGAPLNAADAATKNYVDTHIPAPQSLSSVLGVGNDAGATKIVNLGAPTVSTDAATKGYVDSASNLTPSLNSVLGVGADAGAHTVTNLGAPSAMTDAATKGYVDTVVFNSQAGTTYTVASADIGTVINLTNVGAVTVTIPPASSLSGGAWPTVSGRRPTFMVRQFGGTVTFAAGAGVAIHSRGGLVNTAGQYAWVTAVNTSGDNWDLFGDLA